jgi:hypothetical protein
LTGSAGDPRRFPKAADPQATTGLNGGGEGKQAGENGGGAWRFSFLIFLLRRRDFARRESTLTICGRLSEIPRTAFLTASNVDCFAISRVRRQRRWNPRQKYDHRLNNRKQQWRHDQKQQTTTVIIGKEEQNKKIWN